MVTLLLRICPSNLRIDVMGLNNDGLPVYCIVGPDGMPINGQVFKSYTDAEEYLDAVTPAPDYDYEEDYDDDKF